MLYMHAMHELNGGFSYQSLEIDRDDEMVKRVMSRELSQHKFLSYLSFLYRLINLYVGFGILPLLQS